MRLKTLQKKIRRLEARLQKGATKLAKLKQKLGAAANKAKRKSAARAGRARRRTKGSGQTQRKKDRVTAGAKAPGGAKKVKRKLNLSPERRAQLAAAMKARWAAKRAAAAGAEPQNQPQ